ncbi:DUF3895 domain-containing protein [Paenibacillus gansuensis]|uniref:DUF3895 domain-containing protein n=1 Tax=Paenibacillus gansuensis TaxID=306542 RepID=A0ABW5PGD5_9BACL
MTRKKKEQDLYQGDLFDLFGEQAEEGSEASGSSNSGSGGSGGAAGASGGIGRAGSPGYAGAARSPEAANAAGTAPGAAGAGLSGGSAAGWDLLVPPAAPGTASTAGRSAAMRPGLSEHLQHAVVQELRQQETSVRAVCETLIKKHGAPDKRYVTEKPYIFADVCRYLDQLCREGRCELMSQDPSDRHYRWLE